MLSKRSLSTHAHGSLHWLLLLRYHNVESISTTLSTLLVPSKISKITTLLFEEVERRDMRENLFSKEWSDDDGKRREEDPRHNRKVPLQTGM
jgi:hypothetical protein